VLLVRNGLVAPAWGFGLFACRLELQPDGAMLPTRFRAVLYLDVFGWLQGGLGQGQPQHRQERRCCDPFRARAEAGYAYLPLRRGSNSPGATCSDDDACGPEAAEPWLDKPAGQAWKPGPPSGEHATAPESAFRPESYLGPGGSEGHADGEAGHARLQLGRLPAKVFRTATLVLVLLWSMGAVWLLLDFRELTAKPATLEPSVEELPRSRGRRAVREEPAPALPAAGADRGSASACAGPATGASSPAR